ncbi:mechanosensitive ion channel family protein [Gillisia marina]|uniref:mechanosensitive ion channel family protein n=1 Tax=Gillisia marina TaxID=1167637 RepID=UPI00029A358E|nr:hypothetical protein [Gillisia marina]
MENQLENFADQVSNFLPDLLGAILVLLVGWLIAKGIKALVVRLLRKTNWDERVFGRADVRTRMFS